jgi:pimeloyl-ACP methyl ester carboxylesterase
MIEWTKQIPGAPDCELGIPRKSPITYHCTSRDKSASGLIFVIHGFGEDANSAYDKLLRRYIAETSGLLVVTVEYHCYQARPESGALQHIPSETFERIGFWASLLKVPLPAPGTNILPSLHEIGSRAKGQILFEAALIPANGDYQNFGVLQAMDHLVVLNDIINAGTAFDSNRIFLIGGSHGGYIAHLIARLAPNSISGVIDNSSYTVASPRYLGHPFEYAEQFGNVMLVYNVRTEWQFVDTGLPSYFGPSRAIFRDNACLGNLLAAAGAADRKCQYLMFNTVEDKKSPIHAKRHQLENLKKAGLIASLKEITPEDTGGELFKSMEHADAPMQKLFAHAFGQFNEGTTTLDRYRSTEIRFKCFERIYAVTHSDAPPYVELRVEGNPDY